MVKFIAIIAALAIVAVLSALFAIILYFLCNWAIILTNNENNK